MFHRNLPTTFNLLADAGPDGLFVLDAGLYQDIRFSQRALRLFWLASFAAWEDYSAVNEQVRCALGDGIEPRSFDRFDQLIESCENLLKTDDLTSLTYPEWVPQPDQLPDASINSELRAAAELALFAVGWALLHELRHIRHQQENTGASIDGTVEELRSEEFSCDEFATKLLIDEIKRYAKTSGFPEDKVRQKREIGIYFALFALAVICIGNWNATETHPAMQNRISAVSHLLGSNGEKNSDLVAHAAFMALWRLHPEASGPFKID